MTKIDYLTLSLGQFKPDIESSTTAILSVFTEKLPKIYKQTCRDIICSDGRIRRVSQYGVVVSLQYGKAKKAGYMYSVNLGGTYLEAIERDREAIIKILNDFMFYRIARLDIAHDVCVPLSDWREFYNNAFKSGNYLIHSAVDSCTVYYGSRKSQFFTRVYNKSATDPINYPVQNGNVQIRIELEIKRVGGECILESAFLNNEFSDNLFLQHIRQISKSDSSGFICKYIDNQKEFDRIKTVKRVLGDLERTVDFVFNNFEDYLVAATESKEFKRMIKNKNKYGKSLKTKKILAVLNEKLKEKSENNELS